VDRQLFGRSARQGDPGVVCAIVSADDSLFSSLPAWLRLSLRHPGLNALLLAWVVRRTQRSAERRAWQARMLTLAQDRQLNRLIGFAGRVI
jgi:preprotein translocase subunit SecA